MIPKNIVLKLVSIVYSGKSIGNDLRIKIKAKDQVFSTDISLDPGKKAALNKDIGVFPADQSSFELPVKLTITQKDPIFDDFTHEIFRLNEECWNFRSY